MNIFVASLNTAITKESSWEYKSRILQRAVLTLPLESELFGVRQLLTAKIAPLLTFHYKRLLMRIGCRAFIVTNDHYLVSIGTWCLLKWRLRGNFRLL